MRISDWSSDVCSSDLDGRRVCVAGGDGRHHRGIGDPEALQALHLQAGVDHGARIAAHPAGADRMERSEEHTSELQSLMRISYAVFCLKKKKNDIKQRERNQLTQR